MPRGPGRERGDFRVRRLAAPWTSSRPQFRAHRFRPPDFTGFNAAFHNKYFALGPRRVHAGPARRSGVSEPKLVYTNAIKSHGRHHDNTIKDSQGY